MEGNKKPFSELLRYAIGGGTGAVLNIAAAYVFTSLLGFYYMYSYMIGSLINYTFNFLYHRSITFDTKDKTAKRAAYYYTSNIILGLIALGLTYVLTSIVGLQYLISGIISTIVVVIINYLFSKFITFSREMK